MHDRSKREALARYPSHRFAVPDETNKSERDKMEYELSMTESRRAQSGDGDVSEQRLAAIVSRWDDYLARIGDDLAPSWHDDYAD
jgi:hypothetical protein